MEEAADKLGGIGWLTYYGYLRVHQNKSLDEVWKDALQMARREFENFLNTRTSRERYRRILRLLLQALKNGGG